MRGFTKQKKHLKAIREQKKQKHDYQKLNNDEVENANQVEKKSISVQTDPPENETSLECAYSTLIAGTTYTKAKKFSIHMNRYFCGKTCFYEAQKTILVEVSSYCDESMRNWRMKSSEKLIVSGDGRYPIRRNSSHCSFDIIDLQTNKVLALGTVDKNSSYHPDETFKDTSNLLETEAMRRAIAQLDDIKEKIVGFVIDGDNKNRALLEKTDFHPIIYRDPNHLILSFERYLAKELTENKSMVYGCTDCFWGLRVKLISWYSILIFSDFDPEIKMFAWSSTVGHLTGDHSQCLDHEPTSFVWQIGVDNPEAAVKLQEILDKRGNDFKETIIKGTTNINESFHKEQLIYDDKTVSFPISQEIRDKLAVLRHNEGLLFELNLRKRLKLPDLEEDNYFQITNMDNIRKQTSLFRRTTVYRNQDRLYRKKISDSHKKEKPGDYKRDTDSE